MYFIAAFGVLLMCFSIIMIASPNYWSAAIIRFANKQYFHWFEVSSRFIAGVLFVLFSADTLYPNISNFIGYLLIAVSVGLVIAGEAKHRQFANWSAVKFKAIFRPAGLGSLFFSLFLIYMAIA